MLSKLKINPVKIRNSDQYKIGINPRIIEDYQYTLWDSTYNKKMDIRYEGKKFQGYVTRVIGTIHGEPKYLILAAIFEDAEDLMEEAIDEFNTQQLTLNIEKIESMKLPDRGQNISLMQFLLEVAKATIPKV